MRRSKVQQYARTADGSTRKVVATADRLGHVTQQLPKREFFQKLQANLSTDDPARQDELIDEFRALIVGR